ncbi:MAG: hypothetical protein MST10_10100 [Lentisphaeria bacterium]|nr:hypothetical protein [Lentisphaeria bacterium]
MVKLLFKTFVIFLVLGIVSAPHCARADEDALKLKSATLIGAEFTCRDIDIRNLQRLTFEFNFNRTAYVALYFIPKPGMGISIYDYSITIGKQTFPAVAISTNGGLFDANTWQMEAAKNTTNMAVLIFPVNAVSLKPTEAMEMTLNYNIEPNGTFMLPIPVKNIGDDFFTGGKLKRTGEMAPANMLNSPKEIKLASTKSINEKLEKRNPSFLPPITEEEVDNEMGKRQNTPSGLPRGMPPPSRMAQNLEAKTAGDGTNAKAAVDKSRAKARAIIPGAKK